MNLKHITDKDLLVDTKNLVASERKLTVLILHHIREIDRRKLYSDLKYSNLYDYCVKELGYSEGTAYRRICAARLMNELPEIEAKLKTGQLNLTTISAVVQFFKENDIQDPSDKRIIIGKVEGLSRRECELKLIEMSEKPVDSKKEIIQVSEAVMELLKEYRELKGTNETWEEIISEVTKVAIAELEKTKFKIVDRPRKSHASAARIPSASVKREVFLRDKKCVKCGTKRSLQFDHKHPYSLGGKSTAENIRLLCYNCNQRERIRQRL